MTGRMPEEGINPVEFPDVLHDLWYCFLDLNRARRKALVGIESISYLEIQAYCALTGERFEAWELSTLQELDAIALESASNKSE